MKKYLTTLIALLAIICLPSLARAGTCNASYTNTMPQTSGTGGVLPPSTPGQVSPGNITHIEAVGGPGINFVYTPTVGSPVPFTISFGASSGIVCTSSQAGGWTGTKVTAIQFSNTFGTMDSFIAINGSTAPSNVIICTGLQTTGSPNISFSGGDGLSKVWTGPDPQELHWAGYVAASGFNRESDFGTIGSCRIGPSPPDLYTDSLNIDHLTASLSGGATSVEFFIDGVSKGTDSSAPYDILGSSVSVGSHTLKAVATFPLGTATMSWPVFYAPLKISSGNSVACAITQGGFAQCWGVNNYGQLGANTSAASSSMPLDVYGSSVSPSPGPDLARITDISVGLEDVCAVNNGGVACWGRNLYGILGVAPGTLASSNVPVQVIAQGSGVTRVQVGGRHACALFSSGSVNCWGNGQYGQLGNGSTTAINTSPVLSGTGVTKLEIARNTTYLQIGSDVWAFGHDDYGQIGNGLPLADVILATKIIAGGVTDLWAAEYHACARVSGIIKCWGANAFGELGTGTATAHEASPVTATVWGAGTGVAVMVGGDETTCARFGNPSATKCIGYNAYGQLGTGAVSTMELTPVYPSGFSGATVVDISGGYVNMCAFVGGHMKCAGDNTYGQIGDPAASNPQLTPYTVLGL